FANLLRYVRILSSSSNKFEYCLKSAYHAARCSCCHLEKLHNLEALPPFGFTISCFPHKIRAASAGWTRAVAIMEDHKE
ncbi:MAG: hypothetical protein ACE37D_16925, partial [Pseudomonadales bacterium]